jgi:predicted dehydrogenase
MGDPCRSLALVPLRRLETGAAAEVKRVRVGIIGGGLMGREAASAFGRWFMLNDFDVKPELVAVADLNDKVLQWFEQIPAVTQRTKDYRELLSNPAIEVVYVAVPHDLHEKIYSETLAAGKDLLAEKPFGIDVEAGMKIAMGTRVSGRFVRCSSEFPYYPGAQRVFEEARSGRLGQIIEVRAGFWHSSDLDPQKPINWKRQIATCGKIGVMGDLGMHVVHLPFRLGLKPKRVFAQLQNIVHERPDGSGGMAACDTWDNAILHVDAENGGRDARAPTIPVRLEMKRIAPGETNTWWIEVIGMDGAVKYSTKEPKTFWRFRRDGEQIWERIDLGYVSAFSTSTGGIFEFGLPDALLQMWAAFFAERAGQLGDRFGCVKPEEALLSHKLFQAALESDEKKQAVAI